MSGKELRQMPRWMLRTQVGFSLLLLVVLTLLPGYSSLNGQYAAQDCGTLGPLVPATPTHGPNADQYGGYLGIPIDNSSGYFRTAQVAGRWWLVTPDGHAFYSIGVNAISPSVGAGVSGSYASYNAKQYPDLHNWYNLATQRLLAWGFNTIGSWSDPNLEGRGLVTTRLLDFTDVHAPHANAGFPDVFDPAFVTAAAQEAQANISDADIKNPWLLGYFLDNEIWWYKSGVYIAQPRNSVVENFIAMPGTAAGKQAWVALLKSHYGDIATLNAAWGSSYSSFDGAEATSLRNTGSVITPAADGDKDNFLRQIATQYYSVTSNAVRARDPNHLILGDRHLPPPQYKAVLEAAQPYIDVQSVNVYNRNFNFAAPDLTSVDQAGVWGKKPVLITEFTARAADSGLPSSFGNPGPILPTQDGRADAYRTFINEMLKRPYVVGIHWFPYADDPAVGSRLDQSNNWGLVDVTDTPYFSLVLRMEEYNQHIYQQRVGQTVGAVPTIRHPRAYDKVFEANPNFEWEAVAGVTTYTLQLSRRPDFASPRSYNVGVTSFTVPDPLDAGRWYWRVRAWSDRGDYLAYTYAQPFYVYSVSAVVSLSDFESDADLSGWRSDPPGAISLSASSGGVTSGSQAARLDYNGQSNYNTQWASIYKLPEGADFQPHDWSQYDFLTLDVTNPAPAGSYPLPLVHSAIVNDAQTAGYDWQAQAQPGTEHFAYPISSASKALDLTRVGYYLFGYRLPSPGASLIIDNLSLLKVDHDAVAQPPVGAVAADDQKGGTVELDWVGYQPATTTVAYRVYVSDQPFTSVDGMAAVVTLDATAMHTRVKLSIAASTGHPAPLADGTNYYFAVIPVDAWGNLGPLGQLAQATPTAPNYTVNSTTTPDIHANPNSATPSIAPANLVRLHSC